jgi:Rhs element Vgr protein
MASNSRLLKGQEKTDSPSYRILIEGAELKSKYSVMSIVVQRSVNKIPVAQLTLLDGDAADRDFEASSKGPFDPGKKVTIKLGYEQKEESVFEGIIVKHSVKIRGNQPSVLILELKDEVVKTTITRKNKYYEEKKDSEIIKTILAGFAGKIEDTTVKHPKMVQYYCTDWDFVVTRADVNGLLVFVNDGKVDVKPPDFSKDPIGNFALDSNVYEFEAEMDARDQFTDVESNAWDYKGKKLITSKGKPSKVKDQGKLSKDKLAKVIDSKHVTQLPGKVTQPELDAWADARKMRSELAKIKGRVKIEGYNKVKVGDLIKIEEFSDKFNGVAFISEIRHQFSAGSTWYTDMKFGYAQDFQLKKYDDVMEAEASGLLPGIRGLHIGIVTDIEDPDGEFRVRVRIPIIDGADKGTWAQVSTLDAGKERGSYFRPEVDDEVIVGFINDDPRQVVLLGMLHSSDKASPVEPEKSNKEKGFVTREKIKLMFNDEDKTVTIETPNKNTVIISDKDKSITISDENKNTVVLSDKGIAFTSDKDITLEAKGDIKMEGKNVQVTTKSKFGVEAKSGAELKSNASVTIKGSKVNIN